MIFVPQNKFQQDKAIKLINESSGGTELLIAPLKIIIGLCLFSGIVVSFYYIGSFLWNTFGFGSNCSIFDIFIAFPLKMLIVLFMAIFIFGFIKAFFKNSK
jgi:hypothetical protein